MKKGLRRRHRVQAAIDDDLNRRPDEEGIKTSCGRPMRSQEDLNRRPDEEGIKTVYFSDHLCLWILHLNRRPDEEGIKTVIAHDNDGGIIFEPQT